MKLKIQATSAIIISLALSAIFFLSLLAYIQPMEDASYNLSLIWEGEAAPEDWSYDDKGWTVFTQDNDTVTKLTPDGYGGFLGLSQAGQTFYYSRTMNEYLDSPILRINAQCNNIAVFLDDELLYTDCPELDNEIGRLTLPMTAESRQNPVLIEFPPDYQGKTLTIAQSTPEVSEMEEQSIIVWPCEIFFECNFSSESELIAESFKTAIFTTLTCLAGLLILAAFVWQAFHININFQLLCIVLALLFYALSQIGSVSFYGHYFTKLDDLYSLSWKASLSILLIFLSLQAGKKRLVLCVLTGLYSMSVCIYLFLNIYYTSVTMSPLLAFLWLTLPGILGLAGLLTALVFGLIFWWKESRFYHMFLLLSLAEAVIYGFRLLIDQTFRITVWTQLTTDIFSDYIIHQLLSGLMIAAAISTLVIFFFDQWIRRTETHLMAQHNKLIQKSYQNLQKQHEEVMMIRHDMAKHMRLLRQITHEDQVAEYLDNLIEQNNNIRPVIQCGNKTLDIILNGKLTDIKDSNTKLEIENTIAPKILPLPDADLCSLILNILDNAFTAVSAPDIQNPYIKLDMHISNNYFIFRCKNSVSKKDQPISPKRSIRQIAGFTRKNKTPQEPAGNTVYEHGLGLKIIRQIADRYNVLLDIEQTANDYETTLALPITESLCL